MVNLYLLDTNTCIFIINKSPTNVGIKFDSTPISQIAISSITQYELEAGARKSARVIENLEKLREFSSIVQVISFDQTAAQVAGELKQYLRERGTPIGQMDLLIAAHGLNLRAVVVTNNTKEFARVPNLTLEDWLV